MRRGEVYWANLAPRSGSEQQGTRPVIVVSHDGFNTTPGWRSVIVVPCSTSGAQKVRGPTVVPLPRGAGGLPRQGVALCHQITTLDRAKLTEHVGTLDTQLIRAIEKAIHAALDLEE